MMFDRDFFNVADGDNEQLFSDSELNSLFNFTYQPSSSDLLGLLPENNSMPTANFIAELPPSIEADQDNEFQLSAESEQSQLQYEVVSPIPQQSQNKPSTVPTTTTTKPTYQNSVESPPITRVSKHRDTLVYLDAPEILPTPAGAKIMMDSDKHMYHAGREVVRLGTYYKIKQAMEKTYLDFYHRKDQMIDGKKVTWDAFTKRKYVYKGTDTVLTLAEKKQSNFWDVGTDGKLYVDGKEIVWIKKNNQCLFFYEFGGKKVTWDAFVRRNYIYKDTRELLTLTEKKRCDFSNVGASGEVYVDGREIIWQPKRSHKNTYSGLTLFSGDPKPENHPDPTLQQTTDAPLRKKPRLDDDSLRHRHLGSMNTRKL